MNQAEEIWRDIAGAEGFYRVSNLGRVKSVDRVVTSRSGRQWRQPGKVLKADDNHNGGYLTVQLSIGGKATRHLVHRLVASAFIANPDNLPEVNHSNGIKSENRASNLEWATRQRNIDHAVSTALIDNKGEGNPRAKLCEATVLRIRAMRDAGASIAAIASATGATQRNVRNIVSFTSWKHLATPSA